MTVGDVEKEALTFAWWNAQDFAHFEPRRSAVERWPKTLAQYEAKCQRVDRVVQECEARLGGLDVLAVAETTAKAAKELQERVLPNHSVFSLDLLPRPSHQVAILYRTDLNFEEVAPIAAPGVPSGTRAMAAIDIKVRDERIRIIACHWAAQFGSLQKRTRLTLAGHLSAYIYNFLRDDPPQEKRHVLVLGDFNAEPFATPLREWLWASRSRERARSAAHHTDTSIKRIHLYNAAWRLLGEQHEFDGTAVLDVAGTTYWADERKWATFDQVIVSGTLLSTQAPYFDEKSLAVLSSAASLAEEATPQKFSFDAQAGRATGVSDHLPILGRIVTKKRG